MKLFRKLLTMLDQLWHHHKHHHPHPHRIPAESGVITKILVNHLKIEGFIMSVTISKSQQVSATLTFFAADGVTVTTNGIQTGSLVWSSSDPTLFTVTVPDPTQPQVALITGVADGAGTINWTAVNTNGVTISGGDTVTVSDVAPVVAAASGSITFGTPVSQTPPTV